MADNLALVAHTVQLQQQPTQYYIFNKYQFVIWKQENLMLFWEKKKKNESEKMKVR